MALPFGLPLRAHGVGLGAQVGELAAQLVEPGPARRVLLLRERGLLDLQPRHLAGDLVERRGHRVDLGAQPGAGLVDEVDGLVGQEPLGEVAVRQRRRGDQRAVLDPDAVEDLEPLAQPAQDRDGVLDARLVDVHGLEAPLQRGVLLDVLAVLVERRRADHVQLAAGEHRLEHVAGVHRALGRARADDGVHLVDEQQDPALGGLDLGQHRLQALLELAAVLRARHQQAHVEGEDRPVAQPLGHVAVHDPLGEPLDDRGLPDAGIADEHGVVLGLAGQDLHHAADLGVPADDRVQPARHAQPRRGPDRTWPAPRRCPPGWPSVTRWLPRTCVSSAEERVAGHAVPAEHAARTGAGARLGERDQQVLDRDVLVLEPAGLPLGRLEQRCASRWVTDDLARLAAGPGDARAALELGARTSARRPLRSTSIPVSKPGHQPVGLLEEGEQQVLARRPRCGRPWSRRPGRAERACWDFWVSRFRSIGATPLAVGGRLAHRFGAPAGSAGPSRAR